IYVVSEHDDRQRAQALGATDFAQKPIEREWLVDRLQNHLQQVDDLSVLLVDDDETARYLAHNNLRQLGPIRVLEASEGGIGLQMFRTEEPKLIILGLIMKRMDGFETLARLKENAETKDIPVIVYTSKSLEPEER